MICTLNDALNSTNTVSCGLIALKVLVFVVLFHTSQYKTVKLETCRFDYFGMGNHYERVQVSCFSGFYQSVLFYIFS